MSSKYILLSETLIQEVMANEILSHFTQPHTTDIFFPRRVFFDSRETILEFSFFRDLGEIRYLIGTEEKIFKEEAIKSNFKQKTSRRIYEIAGSEGFSDFFDLSLKGIEVTLLEHDSSSADIRIIDEIHKMAEVRNSSHFIDRHIICEPLTGNSNEIMVLSIFSCETFKNSESDDNHSFCPSQTPHSATQKKYDCLTIN